MVLRLISLIRKEFIQILRDPRTLIVIIVMPIAMLFLLGYAANTDVKNLPDCSLGSEPYAVFPRSVGCISFGKLLHDCLSGWFSR